MREHLDVRRKIHHEFVKPKTIVNVLYYKTVLQKVKKEVKKKRKFRSPLVFAP